MTAAGDRSLDANAPAFWTKRAACGADVVSIWGFERVVRPLLRWQHALFVLYAPIGLCALVVRIAVLALSMLCVRCCVPLRLRQSVASPLNSYVVAPLLGIKLRSRGVASLDAIAREAAERGEKLVLTCNHATPLDPIFVASMLGAQWNFALVCRAMYDFFWKFLQRAGLLAPGEDALLYVHFFGDEEQRAVTRRAVATEIARLDRPLLIFPEAVVTNRDAVLKFQRGALGAAKAVVVPLSLAVHFPWPIEYTDSFGAFPATFLWWFFSPGIELTLRVGSPIRAAASECAESVAQRAQAATAASLGHRAVAVDYKAKVRLNMAMGTTPFREFPRYDRVGAASGEALEGSLWFGGGRAALAAYRAWLGNHTRVPEAAKRTLARLAAADAAEAGSAKPHRA